MGINKNIFDLRIHQKEIIQEKLNQINLLHSKTCETESRLSFMQFAAVICSRLPIEIIDVVSVEKLWGFLKKRYDFIDKSLSKEVSINLTPLEIELPGEHTTKTVLELFFVDRPFVIDSLVEYFKEKKQKISFIIPPVFNLELSQDGKIINLNNATEEDDNNHLYVCCVLENFVFHEKSKLIKDIKHIIDSVFHVTNDFNSIMSLMDEFSVVTSQDVSETLIDSERRLLFQWFASGNAILLGAGTILKEKLHDKLEWDQLENCLGIVRLKKKNKDKQFPRQIGRLGTYFLESNLNVNLIEISERSLVHRKDKIQIIFGKLRRNDGKIHVVFFPILFTSKASRESAIAIPSARLKVNYILEKLVGERYLLKEAQDFFSIMPKSELFRLDRSEMRAMLEQIQFYGELKKTKLFYFSQTERRYARLSFCLPGHDFSQSIFEQIEDTLFKQLEIRSEIKYWFMLGTVVYSQHVFWFPKGHPQLANINFEELEAQIGVLTRSWNEELKELITNFPIEKATRYIENYAMVFPNYYQAIFSPKDAIIDLEYVDGLIKSGKEAVDLRRQDPKNSIIYIYSKINYNLTQIMPLMQNLSLIVQDENIFYINVGQEKIYIYTFYVQHDDILNADQLNFKKIFCGLFLAVLEKRSEDDPLNGLLFKAGLNLDEINLFILYRNYYWQIGTAYSKHAINQAFLNNPEVIKAMTSYFYSKFNPLLAEKSDEAQKNFYELAIFSIFKVKSITEDITFKNILNFLHSTIRTNYFVKDDLLPLAVKIDCKTVDHMPLPRPMYEIYVHGAEVEGIHLRGAKIARGGIRHSDRPDDFRTEILGLMKTQMMKNVVIVPEGSKGGFVPKKQVFSRKETLEEGKKQYKKFISALLSLTDNVIDGKVQSPDNLIIYDESDPYLVVAADKGTAHLSDTANEISEQHGFWLKDAFASGGKNGYDHKKIGITARGAWECVKLHFLELGKDIQKEPFRVVGIGDMAGDVFGNGMLLSDCIMLVGAFNHIHIFVDPNPDPKLSFAERQRLFTMPGSTWMDYDKKLISQGGGVFERSAKSILLSPKLKELLGTEIDEVNGEELIRLLMLCDADLLWNGGIGTYIKATTETSHQVGDPTNDMVRVNAEDLKFKVIGEGGNLGLTQKARIEFNINGGKINTDAIDNSGGVGISDREVNLKILLFEMLRLNIIKNIDERNQLMDDVSPEITRLTLKDNRQQSQIISMDNLRSKKNIRPFIDLIQYLSKIQLLDRRTENITNNNLLNQYAEKGIGVPRPDLAVLLSYTKMYFYKEIIKSKVLDDPNLDKIFMDYFPKQIFIKTMTTKIEHPLKREIIGTMLVNRTINQSGISILPIINNILGASSTEIIIVHSVLTHAFNFPLLREKIIKTIKTKDVHLAYQLLIKIENFILMNMIWVLVRYPSGDISFSLVEPFTRALNEYKEFFDKTLDDYDKAEYEVMLKNLIDSGVNEEIGIDIVQLEFIDDNLELAIMVEDTKLALSDLIGISKALEKDLHYKALKNHLFKLDPTSEWAIKHRGVLIKQLQFIKQSIFRYIVTQYHDFDSFQSGYEIFLNENSGDIRNYNVEFNDFIRTENIDLNGAAVLINTATNIINKMIDISRQQ